MSKYSLLDARDDEEHQRRLRRRAVKKGSRLEGMMQSMARRAKASRSSATASGSSGAAVLRSSPSVDYDYTSDSASIDEGRTRKKPRLCHSPMPDWLAGALDKTKRTRAIGERSRMMQQDIVQVSPQRSVFSNLTTLANPRPLYPEQLIPVVFPDHDNTWQHQMVFAHPDSSFAVTENDIERDVARELRAQPFAPYTSPGPSFADATLFAPPSLAHHTFPRQLITTSTSTGMAMSSPRRHASFALPVDPRTEFEVATPEDISPYAALQEPLEFRPRDGAFFPTTPLRPVPGIFQSTFCPEDTESLGSDSLAAVYRRPFIPCPSPIQQVNSRAKDVYHERLLEFAQEQASSDAPVLGVSSDGGRRFVAYSSTGGSRQNSAQHRLPAPGSARRYFSTSGVLGACGQQSSDDFSETFAFGLWSAREESSDSRGQ